jgi:hypothetical protein
LRRDCDELKKAVEFQANSFDYLKKSNSQLTVKLGTYENKTGSKYEISFLKNKTSELEDHQDEMEQYQRKYNLEIHSIPEEPEEDLEVIVKELTEVLDVDIEYSDIDIVHRLNSKLKMRPIIVKFTSYDFKKDIYAASGTLKYFKCPNDQLNNAKAIHINENLTTSRRRLYADVRKRVKQNNWFTSWTRDGKIFVRKERG